MIAWWGYCLLSFLPTQWPNPFRPGDLRDSFVSIMLVTNLTNAKIFKKPEKWWNPWCLGTHLRVLRDSYPMNTKLTGFRWFSKDFASLCFGWTLLYDLSCWKRCKNPFLPYLDLWYFWKITYLSIINLEIFRISPLDIFKKKLWLLWYLQISQDFFGLYRCVWPIVFLHTVFSRV